MGGLIVAIIIFGFAVGLLVLSFKTKDLMALGFSILLAVSSSILITIVLIGGKSIYNRDTVKLKEERNSIIYLLENNPSYYVIEQAAEYNDKIESGNNYFNRFTIEDRSEFKIDIDYYIKPSSATQ